MTYGTRTDHYPATSKLLQWLVAICVLTKAPVAIAMIRVGKGPTQDLRCGMANIGHDRQLDLRSP